MLNTFKRKLILTWDEFSGLGKLVSVFVLTVAIAVVFSSVTVFNSYYNQLNQAVLDQAKQEIHLNALGLQRRSEAASSIANHVSNLVALTHGRSDFEENLIINLQSELNYNSMTRQVAYYSVENEKWFSVEKDLTSNTIPSHTQKLPDLLSAEKGSIVVFPVDRRNGNVSNGTPAYDGKGNLLGGIIVTGNFTQIFEEIEETELQTISMRAVALKNGSYIWKHDRYSKKYPTENNILKDFPGLPKDFLESDSAAVIRGKNVISFSTLKVPNSEFEAVIFQVREFDTLIQTTQALKHTLWGMSLGYLGFLGIIFFYLARLLGVEIKLGLMEIKEEKRLTLLSKKKKKELLKELEKQ